VHPAASKALVEQEVSTLSDALAKRRGWIFHSIAFPMIDCSFTAPGRTALRLRLHCDNWNDLPPAVSLHSPDGTPLQTLIPNHTGVFNQGPHPATGRPFICMRGAREYHNHPSHLADRWESVKDSSSYTLGGILTQLWHAWLKGKG
jgi:hypothetical protein